MSIDKALRELLTLNNPDDDLPGNKKLTDINHEKLQRITKNCTNGKTKYGSSPIQPGILIILAFKY